MSTVVDLTDRRPPAEQADLADQLAAASPEERRAAAVAYAEAELAGGHSPTGAELHRRFGVAERTGRRIIQRLANEAASGQADRPAATGQRQTGRGQNVTGQVTGQRPQPSGRPLVSGHPVAGQAPANGHAAGERPRPQQPPPPDRPAAGGRPPTAGRSTATDRSTRPRLQAWWARYESRLVTWVVGFAAAAQSVGHMHEVAVMAGQTGWIAWLWPVSVDGLVYAALRRNSRCWVVGGLAVSVAANVLTHYPEVVESMAWAISAWPPIALLGTHWLLHRGRDKEAITR